MNSAPAAIANDDEPRQVLPRLAAFDLDGTLIRGSGELSKRTVAALESLADAGVLPVVATGRPWPQAEPIVRAAGVVPYAVCLNGAVVMDAVTGERIADRSMNHLDAIEAAQIARKLLPDVRLGIDLADGRHVWEHGFAPQMPLDLAEDLGGIRVDDAVAAVDGPVLTWLVESPSLDTLSIVALLESQMPLGTEIRPSGLEMAEIAAAGVNKSSGLASICERYGIKSADTIAFGDGLNDIDMLRWAGISVAMSNAAPAVRDAADIVAASNEEDGVAIVVEALLSLRTG